jgi:hypothetical protein
MFEAQLDGWHAEDEWKLVDSHARDHESAAQDAAQERFWSDPQDPHKIEWKIRVRQIGNEETVKTFAITAEPDVNFYAEEME